MSKNKKGGYIMQKLLIFNEKTKENEILLLNKEIDLEELEKETKEKKLNFEKTLEYIKQKYDFEIIYTDWTISI
jgi:predicted metal-dependent phosphoesterase TrpH